ncbi:MAG: 1,4-dihydroxy-6-naphthoate synthase, partial [Nitrospirae bacterium]|nr:1,4-dihydroxy-6-naphthoate synthase [Nitrospirota bacterium]
QLFDREFTRTGLEPAPTLAPIFVEMPFHKIMDAVANEEVDAGLIIHESRFTYPSYGLKQVIDLGSWWEKETGLPIPLGGIIAKRSLGESLIRQVDGLLKQSVEYAFSNRTEPMDYIKKHSQELSDDVINQHIDLYVNGFSIDVGDEGGKAVAELISRAEESRIIPKSKLPAFI